MKKRIIRWALRYVATNWNSLDNLNRLSLGDLEEYGILDILINEHTKEPMFILKGAKRKL